MKYDPAWRLRAGVNLNERKLGKVANDDRADWAKARFALSRGHYHWQHEPCWYAVRGTSSSHWSGDRKQSTLWTINAREEVSLDN